MQLSNQALLAQLAQSNLLGSASSALPTIQQMQQMFQIFQRMQQLGLLNSNAVLPPIEGVTPIAPTPIVTTPSVSIQTQSPSVVTTPALVETRNNQFTGWSKISSITKWKIRIS